MNYSKIIILPLVALLLVYGCKRQPGYLNIEQAHSLIGANVLAPGFGTIGVIKNNVVSVYYLDGVNSWKPDRVSEFLIPQGSNGILPMGMGVIGVLHQNEIHFHYIDANNQWVKYTDMVFTTPNNFRRLTSMRLPWELGFIAAENRDGVITFYYLDENNQWISDETANFTIPPKTDDYIMIGGMEIGIIKDNRMGVYQLNDFGKWQFLEEMVLTLPDKFEAVLSFEPGTIAVYKQGRLLFHRMDVTNKKWVYDPTMDFVVPSDQ